MESNEKIICLDIIEHIRKRPSLYIANTATKSSIEDGVYSLLKEVVENSIDEIKASFGKKIVVTVVNNSFLIRDFGRGIPLERLLDVITLGYCGGKFDQSIYQKSIGMHGLGLKVVSALSEEFYCQSFRNGQGRKIVTQRGQVLEDKTCFVRQEDGCEIFFKPDPIIFENLQINTILVEKILKRYCCVNPALQIIFNDKELKSCHGLLELLVDMVEFGSMVGEPIYLEKNNIKVIITQNEFPSNQWLSFVNGHQTNNGGIHVDAVKSALWQAALKIMKGEHNMKPEDLFSTVSGIVSVDLDKPEFEAQTKNRLGNVELFKAWQQQINKEILDYWFTDSDECELFFQQVDCNIEKRLRSCDNYNLVKAQTKEESQP